MELLLAIVTFLGLNVDNILYLSLSSGTSEDLVKEITKLLFTKAKQLQADFNLQKSMNDQVWEKVKDLNDRLEAERNRHGWNMDTYKKRYDDLHDRHNAMADVMHEHWAHNEYSIDIFMGKQWVVIQELIHNGKKIDAIRTIREYTPMGLKEAKDVVDMEWDAQKASTSTYKAPEAAQVGGCS